MKALMILLGAWPSLALSTPHVWSFGEPSADRRTLMYWDLEFGMTDTLDLLPLIQGQYSRLAMSPDGELLAVMFDDSVKVSILRLDTGEVVSSFLDDQVKPDRQRHMEFSDGGRMLALNNKTLLLAGSQQDFADSTWVWDLLPFPPITPQVDFGYGG